MFTGLVEDIGTIEKLNRREDYLVFDVRSELSGDSLPIGDSIALDGACLTVIDVDAGVFRVEASAETLRRTTCASYRRGSRVNLERALRVGDRLGGHFVSGHIDAVGQVESASREGQSVVLRVGFSSEFDPLVVAKGSVAIGGVSLTVNEAGKGWLSVNLIPHTLDHTTLKNLATGARLNLEFDMLAKYVLHGQESGPRGTLTMNNLIESGW